MIFPRIYWSMKKCVFYLCALLCVLLMFGHEAALSAAQQGFSIWMTAILPALLPFFVCCDMMRHSPYFSGRGRLSLFLLCFISGAPSGARMVGSAPLSSKEKSDLAAALNNVSPAYVLTSFCGNMLGAPELAAPIIIALFLSAFLMFLRCPRIKLAADGGEEPPSLAAAIGRGMNSMLSICGTVIFFMVLAAVAEWLLTNLSFSVSGTPWALIVGVFEMVSGSVCLSACTMNSRVMAACAAFLFSFGGLCIMTQSLLFCELKPWRYIVKKAIQAGLAACIAYLITPFFQAKSITVFYDISGETLRYNSVSALYILASTVLAGTVILLLGAVFRSKKTACMRRSR